MFTVPPIVVAMFLFLYAIAGAALALGAGWITAWIAKSTNRCLLLDGILGALALPLSVIACALVPFPVNTITEKLDNGGTMSSTMNRYQHPERIGILLAILLPIVYELYRSRKWMSREPR